MIMMTDIWKETGRFLHVIQTHQVTMHRKLMKYLIFFILSALGVFLVLSSAIGAHLQADPQIAQALENQVTLTANQVSAEIEAYTGYGLQLSRELKRDIEGYLEAEGISVSDLNDHPEQLINIQKLMYTELNTMIKLGRSSGVFALVNATVNTSLPDADLSRCGVYLRLANIGSGVTLNPEITLFRGNMILARENNLGLHSRWNMELCTEGIPGYQDLVNGLSKSEYYWISRMDLRNTWDDVILLLVPIYSDAGEFLGSCGIELNAAHFRQYPAIESSFGTMVSVFSPYQNNILRLDQGMTGNTEGTWLDNEESLSVVRKNAIYYTYRTAEDEYYGLQKSLEIPGYDGQQWVSAVLIPRHSCDQYIYKHNIWIISVLSASLMILIIIAWQLSNKFVRPIVQSFQEIQKGRHPDENKYKFTELEELCSYLASKENGGEAGELPRDMEELLKHFADHVKTLTHAEYNIFQYYMNGCKVSQIPAAACISMSTVKKHNGNIYRKLGISSYEELMMYLDLFRRCGCIDQLQRHGGEDPRDTG